MELTPLPSRRTLMGRLWLFVVAALLVPLVLLVVLPAAMGLERFVVTSDDLGDTLPRGSLTFAEPMPAGALDVGDVITFRRPRGGADAAYVTHRVTAVSPAAIRTGDDSGPDPWRLPTTGERARVVAHIPYVGYPFVSDVRPTRWALLASLATAALVVAVLADLERARQRRRVLRLRERELVSGRDVDAGR